MKRLLLATVVGALVLGVTAAGASSAAQSSAVQSSAVQSSAGQSSAGRASAEDANAARESTDQVSADQVSVDRAGAGRSSAGRSDAGRASAVDANAGKAGLRTAEPVLVTDILIPVHGQAPVTAYLVRPAKRKNHLAGALYLHWFEPPNPTQNQTEFLSEAIALAGRGAVAVLPQLTFPWEGDPVGDKSDRTKVTNQLAAVEAAYRALVSQDGVDAHRIAVVGHDYGAMYGSLLGKRVHAMTFMAGDATWANWFDRFWLGLPPDQTVAYRKVFAGLDPVDNVGKIPNVYFQWAGRDIFVTPEVRAAFSAAKPSAKVSLYETADHFLNQQAKDDRLAWVSDQLGLRSRVN
jgi:dienelactone hydrolase